MITVLTPTYNRSYTLTRLYESLCAQTYREFEWIIVDDGSKDNTSELVASWNNTKINLTYLKQDNGGKHRALNYGMQFVKGEYVFIVDSDDYLTKDALELVNSWIKQIDNDNSFAGVSGLRGYSVEQKIGSYPVGREYVDGTNLERKKLNLLGDKAEIYRTKLLKQYPFPEFKGEKFISECIVWDKLAEKGYKIRWFNKIIYIGEYLEDGLTRSSNLAKNNFKGYTEVEKMNIRLKKFPDNYLAIGRYIEVSKQKGIAYNSMIEYLQITKTKFVIGFFVGKLRIIIKKILVDNKNI